MIWSHVAFTQCQWIVDLDIAETAVLLCHQAMAASVSGTIAGAAAPRVLLRGAVDTAPSGGETEHVSTESTEQRLAELETALVAQSAMVAAPRYALCALS